ncbi:MAG: RloB domain-containing protein [Verrucomicrobiae bacterium]|nr:RloB domain-containing protein [Verrucomicrobiae bacterium]
MMLRRHLKPLSRRTLLVVVEGGTEKAFCLYLKASCCRGQNIQVIVKNAHGGSPDKIVEFARRLTKNATYDRVAIIFDTDRPLSSKGEKTIRALRAHAFRFTPCIEGFFLRLLKQTVPPDTESCKRKFHEIGLDEQSKLWSEEYQKLFPEGNFRQLNADADFAQLTALFSNV